MATQDLHRVEPSTDFPTLDETRPCPELRVTRRLILGVAVSSSLVGAAIGFLIGRNL
jgi:hypothetical protein